MNHPLLDVRGWHKIKKVMRYLNPEDNAFRIKLGAGFNVLFDRQPTPRRCYKLMWWSGLFDAKRKRIYEADILNDGLQLWEVFFDAGRFQIRTIFGKLVIKDLFKINPHKKGWVVIGNKYEKEKKT